MCRPKIKVWVEGGMFKEKWDRNTFYRNEIWSIMPNL